MFTSGNGISTCHAGHSVLASDDAVPPQVAEINEAVEQQWKDYEIKPAPDADDATWCRRVYLDLIGRIPTLEELTAFMQDRGNGSRQRLVSKLLYDDRYTEEYANHWASIWCNLLIGRAGGDNNDRMMTNRDGMLKYLRDSFARNKPYDKFVYELVTATGSTKPGTEGFNGAVNFLLTRSMKRKGCLRPAVHREFSWAYRCSARSVTTIHSISGNNRSFGILIRSSVRLVACEDLWQAPMTLITLNWSTKTLPVKPEILTMP